MIDFIGAVIITHVLCDVEDEAGSHAAALRFLRAIAAVHSGTSCSLTFTRSLAGQQAGKSSWSNMTCHRIGVLWLQSDKKASIAQNIIREHVLMRTIC